MNTKLVTGVAVMVLLLGLASHSLIGSAFALDAKGLDNKTKTDMGSVKGASNQANSSQTKTKDSINTDKTKPVLSHAMTKQEGQKINREKQAQDESAKTIKDKAKVAAFLKASQDKSKTTTKDKSKTKTTDNSKPTK